MICADDGTVKEYGSLVCFFVCKYLDNSDSILSYCFEQLLLQGINLIMVSTVGVKIDSSYLKQLWGV